MTTAGTRTRHPTDEKMSAFADGRLSAGERNEVVQHLAACDECRAVFDTVADAQQQGVIEQKPPAVVRGRLTPRAASAALAAAAAVAAVMLVPQSRDWIESQRTAGVSELVKASRALPQRSFASRPAGFPYRELASVMRSSEAEEDGPPLESLPLVLAAGRVLETDSDSAKSLRARGLAHLLVGEVERARGARHRDLAVKALDRAVQRSGAADAVLLNDLAAAYLARARWTGNLSDALAGLAAAERSLRRERTSEALWNRALALQMAGRRGAAARAWNDYLAVDQASPWANEVRSKHLRDLASDVR